MNLEFEVDLFLKEAFLDEALSDQIGGTYMTPQAPPTSQQQQQSPNMYMMNGGIMASSMAGMTSQPGMMTSQPGMMPAQAGVMGAYQGQGQAGMMAPMSHSQMLPRMGDDTDYHDWQMGHQMALQQNMLMMGGAGAHQQQSSMMNQAMMMNQVAGTQPAQQPPMMNTQHLQQVQHQMASMRLASPAPSMMAMPQQGTVTAGTGWGAAPTGNTLSNNLWQ